MRMSMLEELFSGNICPAVNYAKKGGEYQRLISRLSDCVDRLLPLLNDAAFPLRGRGDSFAKRSRWIEVTKRTSA